MDFSKTMELKSALKEYKSRIDKELDAFFDIKIKEAEKVSPEMTELVTRLKKFVLKGGKRIRPILFIISYKCFSKDDEDNIIKASISLELLHNFLLIHDDIIDNAEIRHNGPTMHKDYEHDYKNKYKDSGRFGESMAIIAGDMLFAYCNRIIADSSFKEDRKIKVFSRFNQTLIETAYGECLDIIGGYKDIKQITKEDIERINIYKTAKYTFENPLLAGAILAGANEDSLKALSEFGINMGIAFQIQDDILGLFGSEEKIGKPIDSDIKEGKKTIIMLHALEKADKDQKMRIIKILGNKEVEEKEVEEIRGIVKSTGSLDFAKNMSDDHINKAISTIDSSSLDQGSRKILKEFALYLKNREY